jgi:hypothetical protein
LLLGACGSEAAPPRPATRAAPVVNASPRARPVEIVVLNDTSSAVVLDRSFGPAQPLAIAQPDAPFDARLDQRDDALSHRWVETCECYCPGPCAECEPPMEVKVTLAPGERYRMAWNGMLRRLSASGECLEPVAPPPGRYVFSVCTSDDLCATQEVTLPATADIELRLSHRESVTRCEDLNGPIAQELGQRVRESVARILPDRPVSSCPRTPTCVEPADLPHVLTQTQPGECALLAIPRGNQVEYRLFLPLPSTHVGGANYAHFFDPAGTRLLRTRYEQ